MKLVSIAGAGATTFLLVGATTIEAVMATIGGDIGPGIIGVVVGVLAGLVAVVAVALSWDRLANREHAVLVAYASFGLTLLLLAALSYVNVPGADEYLGFERNLVIAFVVALGAAIAVRQRDRRAAGAP